MRREKAFDLAELQARNLPRCDYRTILTLKQKDGSEIPAEMQAALDEYFKRFLPSGPCVGCGAVQGGKDLIDALFSGAQFVWGLAHGEGHCGACGYPARGLHYDVAGAIERLPYILQYHPDELREREALSA